MKKYIIPDFYISEFDSDLLKFNKKINKNLDWIEYSYQPDLFSKTFKKGEKKILEKEIVFFNKEFYILNPSLKYENGEIVGFLEKNNFFSIVDELRKDDFKNNGLCECEKCKIKPFPRRSEIFYLVKDKSGTVKRIDEFCAQKTEGLKENLENAKILIDFDKMVQSKYLIHDKIASLKGFMIRIIKTLMQNNDYSGLKQIKNINLSDDEIKLIEKKADDIIEWIRNLSEADNKYLNKIKLLAEKDYFHLQYYKILATLPAIYAKRTLTRVHSNHISKSKNKIVDFAAQLYEISAKTSNGKLYYQYFFKDLTGNIFKFSSLYSHQKLKKDQWYNINANIHKNSDFYDINITELIKIKYKEISKPVVPYMNKYLSEENEAVLSYRK